MSPDDVALAYEPRDPKLVGLAELTDRLDAYDV